MATSHQEDLIDRIFDAPDFENLPPEDKWVAGVVLLADVLLRKDPFEREKLLNGLWRELREAIATIPIIQRTATPSPWPSPGNAA